MGRVVPIKLSKKTVLQHGKYCTPEQQTGGVDVKELHIQRENSMKCLSTREKCVGGPTRLEIKKEFMYSKLLIFGMTDNLPTLIKESFKELFAVTNVFDICHTFGMVEEAK